MTLSIYNRHLTFCDEDPLVYWKIAFLYHLNDIVHKLMGLSLMILLVTWLLIFIYHIVVVNVASQQDTG